NREAAASVAGRVVAAQGRGGRSWSSWWVPISAAAAGFVLAVVLMHSWKGSSGPVRDVAVLSPIAQLDIATRPGGCRRPGESTWERLGTGGALPAGSRVRSGAGVRCEFAMADGSEVRMNENTELELSQRRSVAVAGGQVFSSVARHETPFKVAVGGA